MLILLSPAKKLLSITDKSYKDTTSIPYFSDKTRELACLMKEKSPDEIAALMDLSKNLAELNYQRYQQFQLDSNIPVQAYPAIYLFQGDVYQGLNAKTWNKETIDYAQQHLAILSGLYGLLQPLDLIQPYRLEMGVKLANSCGDNLYDFWRDKITEWLNNRLEEQKNPLLINLASHEYIQAVKEKSLNHPMITINFYEQKGQERKMIGILSKKARGTMAKFIMQHEIDDLDSLKLFNELGYTFSKAHSSTQHMDFTRVY